MFGSTARGTPWSRTPRPGLVVADELVTTWVQTAVDAFDLGQCTRAVLSFIASGVTGAMWNKFRMCIDRITRAVGYSRSSVNRALSELRHLHLIKYDGQVHVKQTRPVAVYRLTGVPGCPLPEEIDQARHEAWEDAHSVAPEWELPEDVFPGQHGNETKNPLNGEVGGNQDPKAPVPESKTGIDLSREKVGRGVLESSVWFGGWGGYERWVPHLGSAPEWVAPPTSEIREKGFVRAVRRLVGRFGGGSPSGVLEGAQRRCERVPGRSEGAVSYFHHPTTGGSFRPMPLFADPTFGDLPRDCRLLYLGLRDIAENGQVKSDPRFIKGEVFRYDDDLTASDVDMMISELAESGKVHRIPGYLVISDPQDTTDDALFAVPAPTPKVKIGMFSDMAFDVFWKHYPRRTGKGAARKAFAAAVGNGASVEDIINAVIAYAYNCQEIGKEAQYVPHPATWLNQERWEDDLEVAPQVRSKVDDAFRQGMQLTEYYRQQEALESQDKPKEIGW